MIKKRRGRIPKVPRAVQLQIFFDCLKGRETKEEIAVRYDVEAKYVSYLYYRWKNDPPTSIEQAIEMAEAEKPKEDDRDQRIKELEEMLQYSQLEVEALNHLIDLAEEHLEVDIRKKDGSQQHNISSRDTHSRA